MRRSPLGIVFLTVALDLVGFGIVLPLLPTFARQPHQASDLQVLFLSRIVAGIMAANISTAQAYVADVTTPENRAKGMGMVGAAFGLGFVFGPALGGVLAQGEHPQAAL